LRTALFLTLGTLTLAACGGKPVAPPPNFWPLTPAWTSPFEAATDASGLTPNLAQARDVIAVTTRSGRLRAIDSASGRTLWDRALPQGALAACQDVFLNRYRDGQVAAFEPETGARLWTLDTGVPGDLPPVCDGTRLFVAGKGLASFELPNRTLRWRSAPGIELDLVSPPAVARGRVVAGDRGGALRCFADATGQLVWTYKLAAETRAPAVWDPKGRVLMGTPDGWLVSLGGGSGRRRWRWRVGVDTLFRAQIFEGHAIFAPHDATLQSLSQANGNLAWRTPVSSRPLGDPLLVGLLVFVSCYGERENKSEIVAVEARTGRRIGSFATDGEIQTTPLVHRNRMYVGLRNLSVIALAPVPPTPTPTATPWPAASPSVTPTVGASPGFAGEVAPSAAPTVDTGKPAPAASATPALP
jgi:outer membrane protein assembly factor BamB